MEENGILNINDDIHMFCLNYVFIPQIQKHLRLFKWWNQHGLSTEGHQTPMQLWMQGTFALSNSSHREASEFWEPSRQVGIYKIV